MTTQIVVVVLWALTGFACVLFGYGLGQRDERKKQDHLRRVTKKASTDRIVTRGSSEQGNHAVVHKAHVRRGRISKGQ